MRNLFFLQRRCDLLHATAQSPVIITVFTIQNAINPPSNKFTFWTIVRVGWSIYNNTTLFNGHYLITVGALPTSVYCIISARRKVSTFADTINYMC